MSFLNWYNVLGGYRYKGYKWEELPHIKHRVARSYKRVGRGATDLQSIHGQLLPSSFTINFDFLAVQLKMKGLSKPDKFHAYKLVREFKQGVNYQIIVPEGIKIIANGITDYKLEGFFLWSNYPYNKSQQSFYVTNAEREVFWKDNWDCYLDTLMSDSIPFETADELRDELFPKGKYESASFRDAFLMGLCGASLFSNLPGIGMTLSPFKHYPVSAIMGMQDKINQLNPLPGVIDRTSNPFSKVVILKESKFNSTMLPSLYSRLTGLSETDWVQSFEPRQIERDKVDQAKESFSEVYLPLDDEHMTLPKVTHLSKKDLHVSLFFRKMMPVKFDDKLTKRVRKDVASLSRNFEIKFSHSPTISADKLLNLYEANLRFKNQSSTSKRIYKKTTEFIETSVTTYLDSIDSEFLSDKEKRIERLVGKDNLYLGKYLDVPRTVDELSSLTGVKVDELTNILKSMRKAGGVSSTDAGYKLAL